MQIEALKKLPGNIVFMGISLTNLFPHILTSYLSHLLDKVTLTATPKDKHGHALPGHVVF